MNFSPIALIARVTLVTIVLTCVGVLASAYYLQQAHQLDPCPWCIAQRLLFMVAGLLALAGLFHERLLKAYAGAGLVVTLCGVTAAGYQLWLQADPARAMGCSSSWIEYTLDFLRVGPLWPNMLQYDGPCTLAPWDFLGLSIPAWSLVCFVMLSLDFLALSLIAAKK